LGAFFASQKTGLSAPIPRKRYGIFTSIPCAEEAASAAAPSACRMWHIQQAGCVGSTIAPRLCRLKLSFAVKVGADFRFEIRIVLTWIFVKKA
jgi:hypothetical protein